MVFFKDIFIIVIDYLMYIVWCFIKFLFFGYFIFLLMEIEFYKSFFLYGFVMVMGICVYIGVIVIYYYVYWCDMYGIGIGSVLKGLIY